MSTIFIFARKRTFFVGALCHSHQILAYAVEFYTCKINKLHLLMDQDILKYSHKAVPSFTPYHRLRSAPTACPLTHNRGGVLPHRIALLTSRQCLEPLNPRQNSQRSRAFSIYGSLLVAAGREPGGGCAARDARGGGHRDRGRRAPQLAALARCGRCTFHTLSFLHLFGRVTLVGVERLPEPLSFSRMSCIYEPCRFEDIGSPSRAACHRSLGRVFVTVARIRLRASMRATAGGSPYLKFGYRQ